MSQDLCRTNLQGKSFKGQDLSGTDFSYANIRGTDFSNAKLVGANFSNVQAGSQPQWTFILIAISLILAFVAGIDSGYGGASVGVFLVYQDSNGLNFLFNIIALLVLVFFGFIISKRGWGVEAGGLAVVLSATITFVAAVGTSNAIGSAVTQAMTTAGVVSGVLTGAVTTTATRMFEDKKISVVAIILTLLGATAGAGLSIPLDNPSALIPGVLGAVIVTIALIWLSFNATNRALVGDSRYSLIRLLATALCASKGTNFQGANLTASNFSQANLKFTDFRNANLTNINWEQTKFLEYARTSRTYLADTRIRELLVTKNGRTKKFDRYDLRGLNLQGGNLVDTSLIGSDLSGANLKGADLSRAKLVETRLYHTNLAGACLTGAYIQDWAISTDTVLDDIECDYVYMKLPTPDDPDPWRKPDNRQENFKPGDFTDFIAPIIKTLDLYKRQSVDMREFAGQFKTLDLFHYGGLDPSAAAIAIRQLAENHPEADLELMALEGRGNEKIRLQAKVAGNANQSALYQEYFQTYSRVKALNFTDLQQILMGMEEKDNRIRSLERLLENALAQPRFYVETYTQGDYVMSQSKGNVNISGVQGNVSGVAASGENQTMTGVALGAISGTVTNTINQLPTSSDPDNPGIKELLSQLQMAIEAESELPDADKVEALEQVKTLAEAGQKPEDNVLQKAAKTSMKILKGTVASLPDATKLVEACTKLLPAIATLLALV